MRDPNGKNLPAPVTVNSLNSQPLLNIRGIQSSHSTQTFFDKLVNKKQLAHDLSISESFINKLMAKDGLPYRQIGRAVRFSVKEVTDWLQKRSKP